MAKDERPVEVFYTRAGLLLNLRKGIYAKPAYNPLEYGLQQAGVIFQFDSRVTSVGYLSREIEHTWGLTSRKKVPDILFDRMAQGGAFHNSSSLTSVMENVTYPLSGHASRVLL